jgi:hypothetical protein
MTFEEFEASLAAESPPDGLGLALEALWHDGNGDWDEAHARAQDDSGADGAWVHAYLHRKEGDRSNAAYWYARAGRPMARASLDQEWRDLVRSLLA